MSSLLEQTINTNRAWKKTNLEQFSKYEVKTQQFLEYLDWTVSKSRKETTYPQG